MAVRTNIQIDPMAHPPICAQCFRSSVTALHEGELVREFIFFYDYEINIYLHFYVLSWSFEATSINQAGL